MFLSTKPHRHALYRHVAHNQTLKDMDNKVTCIAGTIAQFLKCFSWNSTRSADFKLPQTPIPPTHQQTFNVKQQQVSNHKKMSDECNGKSHLRDFGAKTPREEPERQLYNSISHAYSCHLLSHKKPHATTTTQNKNDHLSTRQNMQQRPQQQSQVEKRTKNDINPLFDFNAEHIVHTHTPT